jgi:hypothetical protein
MEYDKETDPAPLDRLCQVMGLQKFAGDWQWESCAGESSAAAT